MRRRLLTFETTLFETIVFSHREPMLLFDVITETTETRLALTLTVINARQKLGYLYTYAYKSAQVGPCVSVVPGTLPTQYATGILKHATHAKFKTHNVLPLLAFHPTSAMASLAARRRVSFDAPVQSRNDRLASSNINRNNYYTSDEEEDDEEERLAREEEDEERRLSAANGEAPEAPSSKKRKQTDQEIADLYTSTAKKRKPRVTLQPTHLTGADGLIRIRFDFKSLKYPQKRLSLDAAATYSQNLVQAYKGWAYNLFPGLAFEDVLSRVDTFGSKREIKNHLTHMRTDVRNAHLERIFGRERAERMVNELEDGLKQQQQQHMDDEHPSFDANAAPTSNAVEPPAVTTCLASTMNESPALTRPVDAAIMDRQPSVPSGLVESDSEEELEFEKLPTGSAAAAPSAFYDTDDEEETNDVDDHPGAAEEVSTETAPTSPIADVESSNHGGDAEEERWEASPARKDDGVGVEDPTQSTILPSQAKTHFDDESGEVMDFSGLEPTPGPGFETQVESQTQATLLASQSLSDDDDGSPSQTQATVLASQIGSRDDSPLDMVTLDTVLATQISPTQNLDSQVGMQLEHVDSLFALRIDEHSCVD